MSLVQPVVSFVKKGVPASWKTRATHFWRQYGPGPRVALNGDGCARPNDVGVRAVSDNYLAELGETFKPTKRFHNYLVYYHLHFRDVRERVRTVLEIGLETDRSLRMWEAYFPKAEVFGIDIDPACKAFEGGRRRVFIGDQSDTAFLEACLQSIGRSLDIVIDDGSHRVDHQIASFNYLFPRLSSHGIYVMEDTGGCVGDFRLRTVNRLKRLVDAVFYWPPKQRDRNWSELSAFPDDAPWAARNITGVAFYRWIVFIMRGQNPEDNPYLPRTDAWDE
jgi:hypothetical protein